MSSDDNDSPELIMSADAFIENDISAFQVDVKGLEPATYWERGKAGCREDSFLAAGSANATNEVIMQYGISQKASASKEGPRPAV
jgi:hypothetical protein